MLIATNSKSQNNAYAFLSFHNHAKVGSGLAIRSRLTSEFITKWRKKSNRHTSFVREAQTTKQPHPLPLSLSLTSPVVSFACPDFLDEPSVTRKGMPSGAEQSRSSKVEGSNHAEQSRTSDSVVATDRESQRDT